MTWKIGEICAGSGMLGTAAELACGGELAWLCENSPDASQVLAERFPGVPNHHDLKTAEWEQASPADILTGGFPCFPAGTLILSEEGHVPVEEMKPGDRVLTHRGRWRRVTAVMKRDGAPLWRVRAPHPVVTTAEHPFLVRRQEASWDNGRRSYVRALTLPEWKQAAALERHDRVGQNLPPEAEPATGHPDWWWLAGRYLADGWRVARHFDGSGKPVKSPQGRVVIACGPGKENELRERVAAAGLHATEAPEGRVIKFHILRQDFYHFCGTMGDGAAGKRPSAEALALPAVLAAQVLAGWLAGDGHRDGSSRYGTSVSKALILGMALIARRATGRACSIQYHDVKPEKVIQGRAVRQRPWWRLAIPDRNRQHMTDGDTAWFLVRESEALGITATVYNISVEEDESYVADGLIVHNCQPASSAGAQKGIKDDRWIWPWISGLIPRLSPPPSVIFLENVPNLINVGTGADKGRAFAQAIGSLAALGYVGAYGIYSAAEAGAPHLRKRLFILAAHPRGYGREILAAADDVGGGRGRRPPVPVGGAEERAAAEGAGKDVRAAGELKRLPTPCARDGKGSNVPAGRARSDGRVRTAADGDLPDAVQGLAAGQEKLLPTPTVQNSHGNTANNRGDLLLPGAVLLASPRVQSGGASANAGSRRGKGQSTASDVLALLPTPLSGEARHDSPGQHRTRGDTMLTGEALRLDAEAAQWNWREYGHAVRRWEEVTGIPAPAPVETGAKGQPRLAAPFAEWMMGMPPGWVTGVPGLSRSAQLRIIGNGVVWRQAFMAWHALAPRVLAGL